MGISNLLSTTHLTPTNTTNNFPYLTMVNFSSTILYGAALTFSAAKAADTESTCPDLSMESDIISAIAKTYEDDVSDIESFVEGIGSSGVGVCIASLQMKELAKLFDIIS